MHLTRIDRLGDLLFPNWDNVKSLQKQSGKLMLKIESLPCTLNNMRERLDIEKVVLDMHDRVLELINQENQIFFENLKKELKEKIRQI